MYSFFPRIDDNDDDDDDDDDDGCIDNNDDLKEKNDLVVNTRWAFLLLVVI